MDFNSSPYHHEVANFYSIYPYQNNSYYWTKESLIGFQSRDTFCTQNSLNKFSNNVVLDNNTTSPCPFELAKCANETEFARKPVEFKTHESYDSNERPKAPKRDFDWLKQNGTQARDRHRVPYSDSQRLELEKEFRWNQYIRGPQKLAELAGALNLSKRQVRF